MTTSARIFSCFLAFAASLSAQQTPVDPASTASASDDFLAAFTWEPGGTREADMFQVLLLFGLDARADIAWDGSVSVTGGEILDLYPYRFEAPDRIQPTGGWRLRTQQVLVMETAGHSQRAEPKTSDAVLPKGVWVRGSGTAATRLEVKTAQGDFTVGPLALPFARWERQLDGKAAVQRTTPVTDLSGTELRQHDSPAIAAGSGDTLWASWYSYHDRREELNFRRYQDGRWTRLLPVGRAAEDLWRPQITTDENGKPWLIFQHRPYVSDAPGNWDLYAMAWEDNEWGPLERLSANALPDIEPHVVRAADGTVYVVWQAFAGRVSQIRLKYLKSGRWSETIAVTNTAENDWAPSVAAGPSGEAWIAWDRYNGSYDVLLRSFSPDKGLGPTLTVAQTPRFEAYPSVAVDAQGRPWVAWETSGVLWGKDLGYFEGADAPGTALGYRRRIELACYDGGRWLAPATFAPRDPLGLGATGESRPTIAFDPDGNLWMSFKRRHSRRAYRPSVYWEFLLARLEGNDWVDVAPLPLSWTRKSVRMGMAFSAGRLWAFWPWENRGWAFASRPRLNRVLAGSLELPGPGRAPELRPYRPTPAEQRVNPHPDEAGDVRYIRGYRVEAGDETLRILRGDLHRHTEFSQDAGGMGDGSLPEFYRYMIDSAEMDFGASTDHQAGGTDFWNAITQKMTDMFHFPQRFSTLYAYERNIGNPFGHRNMIYTHRNYPIVPFYQRIDPRFMLPDSPDGELLTFNSMSFGSAIRNDTKLLYDVVKETGGLAIPHTSGSNGMGTDWADNDPEVDTVVEIYQGARLSYEHEGAPRSKPLPGDSTGPGGWQDPGQVWNAWQKGYKVGVIASSDHYSTHISYAMVYATGTSREEIHDAIRQRRTYGATDNIVLDFRLGDHLMGSEFTATEKQRVRVKVRGTADIAAIHLIRDGAYVYEVEPGKKEVEFDYMDNEVGSGEHWYYVRVEQSDGELAWSSPIWVRYPEEP